MIALSLTVLEGRNRAVSTVAYIGSAFGITAPIYAAVLVVCGAVLLLLRVTNAKPSVFAFAGLTLPLLFYVAAAIFYFASQPELSRSPLVLYAGLYILLMRRTFADALADVAADTRIGDAGDELNTTYYHLTDRVHLNNAGYAVVAPIVKAAIDSIP